MTDNVKGLLADPYRSIKLPNLVREALYNAHTDNIRDEEDVRYGTGVIVGVVSMVTAVNECGVADAIGAVRGILAGQQQKVDRRCIPGCWRELWPT
jgi:hypothetical protein